jgi:hypothetical protein
MSVRLVFLTVVCVGSLAFGQDTPPPQPTLSHNTMVPFGTKIKISGQTRELERGDYILRVAPAKPPAHKTTKLKMPPYPSTTGPAAPDSSSPTSPQWDDWYKEVFATAPQTPAPAANPAPITGTFTTPSGTPLTPSLTPAPQTPAPAAPMGFTMHFNIGGSFHASFDMDVTQGQAKQKAAKKHKSGAAKQSKATPIPSLTPSPASIPRPAPNANPVFPPQSSAQPGPSTY